jgi:Rrf2 family protein
VKSHKLARAEGVNADFSRKVLRRLTAAGILESQTGNYGGYRLARPAKHVTLLEVVEAVDGPLAAPARRRRGRRDNPKLRAACDEVLALARERLAKVTLAELAKGK